MKKLLFAICFLAFLYPLVLTAQNCQDYTCNIAKARTALSQKKFKEAIDYCKAAKAYPNANIAEADALIYKIFEAIEAQKKLAENAQKRAEQEKLKAIEATQRAELETENAKKERDRAEIATKRAEKTARAAKNTATFMGIRETNPPLALRMMHYNYMNHPEDEFTHNIYHQTITNPQTAFLLKKLRGHTGAVNAVAFSPDGKKVVTGSEDKTAKLWDVENGKVEKTFIGHTDVIYSIAFSPDGRKVVTGSTDETAKLWNVENGKVEKTFIGHTGLIYSIAFSPDEKTILTGSDDGTVKLWDIESDNIEKTFTGHTERVMALAFSRDGKKIFTGSDDKTVRLWNIEKGITEKKFSDFEDGVSSISISSNDKSMVTVGGGGAHYVILWDIETGKVEKKFSPSSGGIAVFSSDEKKILWSGEASVEIFDVKSGKKEASFLINGDYAFLPIIAFSPDRKRIITGLKNSKEAQIWDIGHPKEEKTFDIPFYSHNISFSPDGNFFLMNTAYDGIQLFNIGSKKVEKEIDYTGLRTSFFSGNSFSTDGKKILTCYDNGLVKLWDIASGKSEKTFIGHTSAVYAAVFSPDGKKVLTGSSDNTVKLWDIAGEKAEKTFIGHKNSVSPLAFSPDGKKIITGSYDNTVKLWDIESEKIEKTFIGHTKSINVVVFSPDGKKILTGSKDKTIRLWDIDNAKEEKTFIGHSDQVNVIVFLHDGKKFLTGSNDKTVKLWDIATGKAEKTFIGNDWYIIAIYLSSNGFFFTGTPYNVIKQWNIEKSAIEDIIYAFSLYEMAQAGLQLESKDSTIYRQDRIVFTDEIRNDTIEYQRLIAEWKNSEAYKQHSQKIEDWTKSDEYQKNLKITDSKKAEELDEEEEFKRKNPISFLRKEIEKTKDKLERYKLYEILIDSLKRYLVTFQRDSSKLKSYKRQLAEAYNSHAWEGFFLKKFQESEWDINAGLILESTNKYLHTNLAPALLLQGKFNEAKAEYEKWKDKDFGEQGLDTYRHAFLNDLLAFEKAGIIPKEREKDVAAIRKLLEKKE